MQVMWYVHCTPDLPLITQLTACLVTQSAMWCPARQMEKHCPYKLNKMQSDFGQLHVHTCTCSKLILIHIFWGLIRRWGNSAVVQVVDGTSLRSPKSPPCCTHLSVGSFCGIWTGAKNSLTPLIVILRRKIWQVGLAGQISFVEIPFFQAAF